MRIITGQAKGRRLASPAGLGTRPMQDRVKEAVFSSLGPIVYDANIIDLFAGSGSMGLEALSRGAAKAVFVESDRHALAALRSNVEMVGLGGEIVAGDVGRLKQWSRFGPYDLAFVDPPYDLELASVESVLSDLCATLQEGATVIVHRRKGEGAPAVACLELTDERSYGTAQLFRFEKTSL